MDQSPNNPEGNDLRPGVTAEQVAAAVERSGYPLQTSVASLLAPSFGVQEEWCYVDRDTTELRSIDLRADMCLHEWEPQPRVRPSLTLLVECKQSALPYVFFRMNSALVMLDHPKVYGLRSPHVVVSTDDDGSTWTESIVGALGLTFDDFQRDPLHCSTFSKCVRKGSDIELSGTEAYASVVLPLVKALEHFERAEAPPGTAWYFDAHLTIALGVLDAPMVSVDVNPAGHRLVRVPWVRVVRHEYGEGSHRSDRERLWAVDLVHKDFLLPYLETHLLPFARRFAERVLRHPTELATGEGFASGMNADTWGNLEQRLQPRRTREQMSRAALLARHVIRLVVPRQWRRWKNEV